ncbi:hypothetical protein RI103_13535 [Paraburkholderia sp. FT54]|uniref:hypothetical protein n=1 Tax=Paraburkholderia sp. FT54 TaxID=3074437 RepID=UPI0028775947|nr:hypothetical protein [Paraburkholderia sp. FT54]WNC88725.1 hypothetical protein RI103_13535 [Paraburkholderia sp. FT54]
MYNETTAELWAKHELRIRRLIFWMSAFAIIAVISMLLPFINATRPASQTLGAWWSRAGAPMTVFAIFSQNVATRLGEHLQFGAFGSSEMVALRQKYLPVHAVGFRLSIILTVVGTLIWGYGDLLICMLSTHK